MARTKAGHTTTATSAAPLSRASDLRSPWVIAVAGLVSLAVAMGIGRFAFTPLLPMMLKDGVVDLPGASWLASANYMGYLVGALLCTLQPWIWARFKWMPPLAHSSLVRAGLVTTSVLTLMMAWHAPSLWPLLRFAAGVTSGVVFVFTSGWCLSHLARLGVPGMGGIIYAGPGLGIVVSGLLASGMVASHWTAAAGWLTFGVLAFGLTALVWRMLRGNHKGEGPEQRLVALAPRIQDGTPAPRATAEVVMLTLAYGLAGFGYIITATFLPVIARASLPGSPWLDMFWPIFGFGIMMGALLATRLTPGRNLRGLLVGCYLVQATGIATSLVSPSLAGFAIGSLLLGIPFTALTFFAMQEIRRLRPATVASHIGLLTATYGIGQILGPLLVAVLLRRSHTRVEGFATSLEVAACALVVGAAIYAWLARTYPAREQVLTVEVGAASR